VLPETLLLAELLLLLPQMRELLAVWVELQGQTSTVSRCTQGKRVVRSTYLLDLIEESGELRLRISGSHDG
jgi:hypothetical protein